MGLRRRRAKCTPERTYGNAAHSTLIAKQSDAMRSLRQKLQDLPSVPSERREPVRTSRFAALNAPLPDVHNLPEPPPLIAAPSVPPLRAPAPAPPSKPSLDELRARIAALIGHREPLPKPADPSASELPFVVEQTPLGPRYVRRVRAAPAARVGRAPLHTARSADVYTLSLLALDPKIADCDPKRALYVDTETTGLSGGTGTVAFLLGLAFFDEEHQSFTLEQMLLRRLGEEAPMLELFAKRLADASMIVTFNGKTFDFPLLRTRFVMNRFAKPNEPPHLDLLHVARRVHSHRLPSCNLASLESHVLGRERVGDVSGMDIVEAYMHFLRSGDESALSGVVTHNEHDVMSMVALLGLYGEPFGVQNEPLVNQNEPFSGARTEPCVPSDASRRADSCAGIGAGLCASDLAGVAKTLHRAGAVGRARALADEAVRAGGGVHARRVSGDISRARGDVAEALLQYETLLTEVEDPAVRLLLAKLYEHKGKAYDRALSHVEAGTHESPVAAEKRRLRLTRKLELLRMRETTGPKKRAKRS
ncbi:MAG: ribonuclease H-like domain-containing protein [Polyangiaceae bacterium]|nr:ribonuclease H-like domain-containing protein [Polyangiaceae bacterium]